MNACARVNCYDSATCLHVDQLCASCKGNMDLEDAPLDHYERTNRND